MNSAVVSLIHPYWWLSLEDKMFATLTLTCRYKVQGMQQTKCGVIFNF